MRKSFKANPNFCLIDLIYHPSSECMFDSWSIHHFYWQGFFYMILHHLLKIKNIKHSIILTLFLTILHIIEEYFGNTGLLSFEGIIIDNIGPIINSKIDVKLRNHDNDYLDNSIGDILAGLLSCILITYYWIKYNKLPYFYLLFIIVILFMLYKKSYMLYPKNNKNSNSNKNLNNNKK